jgi:flagellar export protein FliJ
MPSFEFPLLSLLRVRRMLEHQQHLALQRANQVVAASQQRIADANASLRASQMAWTKAGARATSAELQFLRDCEHNCRLAIAQAQQEHIKLVSQAAAERDKYLNMKRQSEVLQHLHDQALDNWRIEEARREQQKVDEMFLMRHASVQRNR